MLPNFSGLSLETLPTEAKEESYRSRNNRNARKDDPYWRQAKKYKDKAESVVKSLGLRAGWRSEEYQKFTSDIAADILKAQKPKPGTLRYESLVKLQEIFNRFDPPAPAFVPSYESYNAVSPSKGIDAGLAAKIALAFFDSDKNAPNKEEQELENEIASLRKELEDLKSKHKLLERNKTSEEHADEQGIYSKIQNKLLQLEGHYEKKSRHSQAVANHFASKHIDLVREYALDAVDSLLSLPSSDSQPALRFYVALVLQTVDKDNYYPFADGIHMDNEVDMFRTESGTGTRYGRPASEQDISSLVASFCADLINESSIALSGCGTVYFDGMPIINPELLVDAAKAVQERPDMEMYTEYEIISEMGQQMIRATTRAIENRDEDQLRKMGITSKTAPMLKWSNVNALSFHRSALRDEVLAGSTKGIDAPRMRAFGFVHVDDVKDKKRGNVTINLGPITRGGRTIELAAHLQIISGGRGAGMGEDMMP